MAVDVKPGAKLYRGNLMGSSIEKDPITLTSVEGTTASYTGTTGKTGKGTFAPDEEGVTMKFANGSRVLYVNEVEGKYGPTHGLGRRRRTRHRKSRRHQRKTRRSRK